MDNAAPEIRNGRVEVDKPQINPVSQRLRLKSLQASSGDVRKAVGPGDWGSEERSEASAYRPWRQPGSESISGVGVGGTGKDRSTQRDSRQVGNVTEHHEGEGKAKSG